MTMDLDQISFDEMLFGQYKITNPIRLIELFGGIGSQAKALERLGANFEHYRLVEYDKYPVASYNAVHGTNFVPQDITKTKASDLGIVDRDKYTYIMTYSFPCQDLSMAGKRAGMKKGSHTRSGLLWEVERILNECENELPQVLLMENVKAILSEQTIDDFKDWIYFLEKKGYSNYYQVLNSKDYGIPQNRERCFMVSILGEAWYGFPKPIPLNLKLKDMLEEDVDEKYFLSAKMINYISHDGGGNYKNPDSKINLDIARPLTTEQSKRAGTTNYWSDALPENIDLKILGQLDIRGKKQIRNVYDKEGLSPTLDTMQGDNRQPKIVWSNKHLNETLARNEVDHLDYIDSFNRTVRKDVAGTICAGVDAKNKTYIAIKNATAQGYLEATDGDGVDISSRMETHRGTVQKDMAQTLKGVPDVGVVVKDKPQVIGGIGEKKSNGGSQWYEQNRIYENNIATSVTCDQASPPYYTTKEELRIRKLTPRECWRLMGFDDVDFDKASQVNSNAQLYKQTGNSIVVNVLEAIFKQML